MFTCTKFYETIGNLRRHLFIQVVVTALKQTGMWENTILIFFSDNGGPLEGIGNGQVSEISWNEAGGFVRKWKPVADDWWSIFYQSICIFLQFQLSEYWIKQRVVIYSHDDKSFDDNGFFMIDYEVKVIFRLELYLKFSKLHFDLLQHHKSIKFIEDENLSRDVLTLR